MDHLPLIAIGPSKTGTRLSKHLLQVELLMMGVNVGSLSSVRLDWKLRYFSKLLFARTNLGQRRGPHQKTDSE